MSSTRITGLATGFASFSLMIALPTGSSEVALTNELSTSWKFSEASATLSLIRPTLIVLAVWPGENVSEPIACV